jgi:hypothetical protein
MKGRSKVLPVLAAIAMSLGVSPAKASWWEAELIIIDIHNYIWDYCGYIDYECVINKYTAFTVDYGDEAQRLSDAPCGPIPYAMSCEYRDDLVDTYNRVADHFWDCIPS